MSVREAFAAAAADIAVSYLEEQGFRVLGRDLEDGGEIVSILAVEGGTLVLVDLRVILGTTARRPLGEVDGERKHAIGAFAARWLCANGKIFLETRIDVVGLVPDGRNGFTVEHVRAVS